MPLRERDRELLRARTDAMLCLSRTMPLCVCVLLRIRTFRDLELDQINELRLLVWCRRTKANLLALGAHDDKRRLEF